MLITFTLVQMNVHRVVPVSVNVVEYFYFHLEVVNLHIYFTVKIWSRT